MKHVFVLDLSTLMSEPVIALRLLTAIDKSCHTIAIEYGEVWKAYKRKWPQFDINVGKLLSGMPYRQDKLKVYEPSKLPWEGQIKQEDRKFVRLAQTSGAILVTEDQPLIETLRKKAHHGIKVMKSNEALRLAEET